MDRARASVCLGSREFAAYCQEPLPQRPAGSTGKHGVCTLSFAVARAQTRLQHSFVTHPFHLTRCWHLDPALPEMAVVYLQNPTGGLIQGDRLQMEIDIGPAAQVHLTQPAAEKIHTMTANCALHQVSFTIGASAYAEYCSEPVILFPGARFAQDLDVTLRDGARFFLSEIFVLRRAVDGATFTALSAGLQVRAADGTLLMRDRSLALPGRQQLSGVGILAEQRVWGQALFVGSSPSPAWARELHTTLTAVDPAATCGVTELPWNCGIGVKVVGATVHVVRRALYTAWQFLRCHYLGVPAPVFAK